MLASAAHVLIRTGTITAISTAPAQRCVSNQTRSVILNLAESTADPSETLLSHWDERYTIEKQSMILEQCGMVTDGEQSITTRVNNQCCVPETNTTRVSTIFQLKKEKERRI